MRCLDVNREAAFLWSYSRTVLHQACSLHQSPLDARFPGSIAEFDGQTGWPTGTSYALEPGATVFAHPPHARRRPLSLPAGQQAPGTGTFVHTIPQRSWNTSFRRYYCPGASSIIMVRADATTLRLHRFPRRDHSLFPSMGLRSVPAFQPQNAWADRVEPQTLSLSGRWHIPRNAGCWQAAAPRSMPQ